MHFAQNAERGLFDFLFLAEGLRLREHRGRIHDLDVVGPARHLHRARRARRRHQPHLGLGRHDQHDAQRAVRARPAVRLARPPLRRAGRLEPRHQLRRVHRGELPPRRVPAPRAALRAGGRGRRGRPGLSGTPAASSVEHHGPHFDVRGRLPLPPSPQGHPVLIQAGDSAQGREFGAATADAIFSRHGTFEAGQAFYRGHEGPAARATAAARPISRSCPRRHLRARATPTRTPRRSAPRSPPAAGLPADRDRVPRAGVGPGPVELRPGRPAARRRPDRPGRLRRSPAAACGTRRTRWPSRRSGATSPPAHGGLSIRELIIETTARQSFVGTPQQVAAQMDESVQARRLRRLHPRAAPDARRPRPVRRRGRARSCRTSAATAPRTPDRPCATTSACATRTHR